MKQSFFLGHTHDSLNPHSDASLHLDATPTLRLSILTWHFPTKLKRVHTATHSDQERSNWTQHSVHCKGMATQIPDAAYLFTTLQGILLFTEFVFAGYYFISKHINGCLKF